MFFEWWMIVVFVIVAYIWSEHRFRSGQHLAWSSGYKHGIFFLMKHLIKENYLKVNMEGNEFKSMEKWKEPNPNSNLMVVELEVEK